MWDFILTHTIASEKYGGQNFADHKQIADMIISGDAYGIYTCMKKHMEKLVERFWD